MAGEAARGRQLILEQLQCIQRQAAAQKRIWTAHRSKIDEDEAPEKDATPIDLFMPLQESLPRLHQLFTRFNSRVGALRSQYLPLGIDMELDLDQMVVSHLQKPKGTATAAWCVKRVLPEIK